MANWRSTMKNIALVLFAFWVNISTTGGVIYGMASLTQLMDKELGGKGQLYQKCKRPPDDCKERDQIWSNIFSIAVAMSSVGTATSGVVMDWKGPKASCLLHMLFLLTGNYLLGTTDTEEDGLELAIIKFTIGFSIVAFGGMGPYISSYNIANVTKVETTITSLIAAIFNVTGLTYFTLIGILDLVDVAVDKQRESICLMFTYICIGQIVLIYLFWPVRAYAPQSQVERLIDLRLFKPEEVLDVNESMLVKDLLTSEDRFSNITDTTRTIESPSNVKHDDYIPLDRETLRVQILSKEFILGTVFYSFCLLAMSFYLGTIFVQADNIADWFDTYVLLQANITPIVIAWPCAMLLDRFGFGFGVALVGISSVGMFCTLLFNALISYVISAIFLGVFRCFVFATFFGFVGNTFGFNHYGAVVGAAAIISGVTGQLVVALNWVAYQYDFVYINVGLAVISVIFVPLGLTLSVWETDKCSDDSNFDNFGARLSFRWSRVAGVTPRRQRVMRKNMHTERGM